jgi:hypothetical protein
MQLFLLFRLIQPSVTTRRLLRLAQSLRDKEEQTPSSLIPLLARVPKMDREPSTSYITSVSPTRITDLETNTIFNSERE